MNRIEQILELEKLNNKQIRLYKKDKYWLAFERSAFNLFSVQCVETIFKIEKTGETGDNGSMLVALVKNREYDHLLANPQFSVLRRSENEILLDCRFTCGGFQHWKDSLIPLFSRHNLRQDLRDVLPFR